MSRRLATTASLAVLGIGLASFVVLGFGRVLLGYRTAALLAAPLGLTALAGAVLLFVGFLLARVGVGPLADDG